MPDIEPDYDAVYLEEHPELITDGERFAAEMIVVNLTPPAPPPPPPLPSDSGVQLSSRKSPRYGSREWIEWNRIIRVGHLLR